MTSALRTALVHCSRMNGSIGSCPAGGGRYLLTVRNRIPQGRTFKRFRLSWAEYREAFNFWRPKSLD